MQKRLAPRLGYSQQGYERVLDELIWPGCRWLDVGCGHAVLPPYRLETELALVERAGLVVGVDLSESITKHRTIADRSIADIEQMPFADGSFDLVTANMVVEHMRDPAASFAEIRRVLKPDGVFLFHTPNRRGHVVLLGGWLPDRIKAPLISLLEGRASDDVFPTHYRANDPERIQQIAAEAGFGVRDIRMIASTPAFALFPPFAVVELLWIRATMKPTMARWRQNIIASLQPESPRQPRGAQLDDVGEREVLRPPPTRWGARP
jgi:SAM-dependent methyltransferase